MGIVGDLLTRLSDFAVHVLVTFGYPGLFLLMAAESMVFPVPSEVVMPFAGSLVASGQMTWTFAILASSFGSVFGSYLSYLLGQYGFVPIIERYGKYVFLHKHHLDSAHHWFARRGAWAIFLCRFIPGVRHVISIPAGSARMPLRPFLLATFVGATIWNVFLLWIGYKFASNPDAVKAVKGNLDLIGLGMGLLIVAYITYEIVRGRRARRLAQAKEE